MTFLEDLLTDSSVVLPDAPRATPDRLADARRVLDGRWLLVGESYDLGANPDWRHNPSTDKEWQIAQHKHYFGRNLLHGLLETADGAYLDGWSRLLRSWLEEMGTGFITQSDAQVEALRLRSWVDSLLLLRQAFSRGLLVDNGPVDDELLRAWVERMGDEARYVATHLKPVRNHRTFQLHSVFLVGLCVPHAPGAADLVDETVDLLTDNLLREILPDGVHVEMATHYHNLVAETALHVAELAALNGIPLDPALLARTRAAATWTAWLQWPDGHIPLLGDSDDGDHAALLLGGGALFHDPALTWAGSRGTVGTPPAVASRDFPDAGYTVLSDGWADDPDGFARRTHILMDSARLGEGAHAHYDALSLVVHCDGRPALIDPGRYTYSGDPDAAGTDWRHAFKSTRAHNTVHVDGRDQTRYLSRNKHGPDAEVVGRHVILDERGTDLVLASVRSAEYTPLHTRAILFVRREFLVVLDRVDSHDDQPHEAEVAWHLPDDVDACFSAKHTAGGWTTADVSGSPASMLLAVPDGSALSVDDGWVSVLYGVKTRAPVVRATVRGSGPLLAVTVVAPRKKGLTVADVRRNGDAWVIRTVLDGRSRADRVRWPASAAPYSSPPAMGDFLEEDAESS